MKRAYYQNTISNFLSTSTDNILGILTENHHFSLDIMQKNAWIGQIRNLKEQLTPPLQGSIFLEFSIPRMGKRVDVVLFINGIIFVIEYKVGSKVHDSHAKDQTMDYALDLKNFHEGSHSRCIVPILVSTKAKKMQNNLTWHRDQIASVLLSSGDDLIETILLALKQTSKHDSLNVKTWQESGYKPTPTIVEAAQALYQGHSVEAISRSDAGAKNLSHTSHCISDIIDYSKEQNKKSICFITGVPGAGKTLAGLNISTQKLKIENNEHAVFLSGNGPLVTVLREALARDEVARTKAAGNRLSKKEAHSKISSFIQNIHHFRDEAVKSENAPIEHVVIFDEAQRAWNREKAQNFMEAKKGVPHFDMSEPEFLISVMDRKNDWCTIICLIGGGQEINTGEAGLTEWFEALKKHFKHWDVYYSDHITHKNYSWGQNLPEKLKALCATQKSDLHLSVSVRSYRAEELSNFVAAIIDGNSKKAKEIYKVIENNYPIYLTRDLTSAKAWLKKQARGNERFGIVASAGGIRLKAEGIHVKNKINPATWFLNNKDDVRSSYYLEDVATQFDVQGLELDWACLCWDADFRREKDKWATYAFKGTKWQNVKDVYQRIYVENAYRVLLTRARQGMAIFIPNGNDEDYTRPSHYYDETYQFLKECGLSEKINGQEE